MRDRSRMRISGMVLLSGCLGMVALIQAQVPQNVPTFAVAVDLVKVPVTVFGLDGAPLQAMNRQDFRVYEDGESQPIRSLGLDTNPVSVVLLLDCSGTVTKEWRQIREAAEGFSEALAKGDRISVITFSDDIQLMLDWTEDAKQVRKSLGRVQLGFRTNLYDAMFEASQTQLKNIEGRKAIILLTDFLNNQSLMGYREAVQAIVQSQASLYIVSKTLMVREAARTQRRVVILNDIYQRLFGDANYIDEFFAKKEAQMTELAEKTGGRCYFPLNYNEIKDVYKQVAQELRNQYFLTYISESTKARNSFHNISVEYLQPASRLIYRKGYYFKPDPIFNPREGMRQR